MLDGFSRHDFALLAHPSDFDRNPLLFDTEEKMHCDSPVIDASNFDAYVPATRQEARACTTWHQSWEKKRLVFDWDGEGACNGQTTTGDVSLWVKKRTYHTVPGWNGNHPTTLPLLLDLRHRNLPPSLPTPHARQPTTFVSCRVRRASCAAVMAVSTTLTLFSRASAFAVPGVARMTSAPARPQASSCSSSSREWKC